VVDITIEFLYTAAKDALRADYGERIAERRDLQPATVDLLMIACWRQEARQVLRRRRPGGTRQSCRSGATATCGKPTKPAASLPPTIYAV
jgi:hypothetical protein